MREILYKAKTTPKEKGEFNEVWVKGDLVTSNGKYYIHPKGNPVSVINELGRLLVMHEVQPTTICQFTGLLDKNGNKIWENDVCKGRYWENGNPHRLIGKVDYVYVEYLVCGVKQYEGFHSELNGAYEVIGNVFDNKELLED